MYREECKTVEPSPALVVTVDIVLELRLTCLVCYRVSWFGIGQLFRLL